LPSIITVKGPIPQSDIGITLTHDHLLVDTSCWWVKPLGHSKLRLVDAPVTIEILGEIRRDFLINKDNLELDDMNLAIRELNEYKEADGKTLVEVTSVGLKRNPIALRKISEATGVNIIAGTGWYLDNVHPTYVKEKSIEELAEIVVRELTEGIEGTEIRAGVIGEIGCSDPLTENEKKVLQAVGRAQSETKASVTVHVGCWNPIEKKWEIENADEYLELILKGDGDPTKLYLSHMDNTCRDLNYHKRLIERYGVVLNYDGFGSEFYSDSLYPGAYGLCDAERVKALSELVKSGYEKQLMLSHDICSKIQLRRYGGYGYAHILKHIVPSLKYLGVSDKQVRTMLIENPTRILAF